MRPNVNPAWLLFMPEAQGESDVVSDARLTAHQVSVQKRLPNP